MVKRLYDPTIFVNSLDSIDRDKYIIATYYIEDSPGVDFIDHFAQLQRLVLEGSTGSWARVEEETEEVREVLAGRLVGYYEIPAEQGTKKAVIQIAYPTAAWEISPNLPMMLLGPAGNCFIFSSAFRVLDVAFPPTISTSWAVGPASARRRLWLTGITESAVPWMSRIGRSMRATASSGRRSSLIRRRARKRLSGPGDLPPTALAAMSRQLAKEDSMTAARISGRLAMRLSPIAPPSDWA